MSAPAPTAPVLVGTKADSAGSTTCTATLTGAVPAGALLRIQASCSASTAKSASDTAGNIYRQTEEADAASWKSSTFYVVNALPLGIGDTVSVVFRTTSGLKSLSIFYTTNVPFPGLDLYPPAAAGNGTAVSITTPYSISQAVEIMFADTFIEGGSGDSFTEDPQWTTIAANTGNTSAQRSAYRITNGKHTASYTPHLGTARNWATKIETFRALVDPNTRAGLTGGGGSTYAPITTFPTWGILDQDGNRYTLATNLGAQMQRQGCPVNGTLPVSTCQAIRANGQSVQLEIHNNVTGGPANNAYPTNMPLFRTLVAQAIEACLVPGDTVNFENEVSDNVFWTGTAAQYLDELANGVEVAHSLGYTAASDGFSSTQAFLAYWNYLYSIGQIAAADAFAQVALIPQANSANNDYASDLPSFQYPNLPILGNHPGPAAALQLTNAILQGLSQTGVDYLNVHIYWWMADYSWVRRALQWMSSFTRLPLVCNEAGELNNSATTATVANHMGIAMDLGFNYHLWNTGESLTGSMPLGDNSGNLYPNGIVWKNFAAAYRSPTP